MMRIRHTGRRVTMEVSPSALRGVVGGMLLLGFLACRAHADLLTWSNPAGGDFLNAANWTPPKIPGTNDIVVFDLPGPYEVTWSGNATGHSFRVTQGTVTWNLNGKTFGVNRYSTNSVGTVGTTADLTITNGTVIRMNAGYLSSFAYSFKLKGAGTAMRLLAGGKYLDAYYTEYGAGTTLLLDGAGAEYSNGGMYSRECKGTIIVTNGAYLNGYGGWTIQTGADLRFSGAGERGYLAITSMAPGSSLRVDNGAGVKTSGNNQTIDGTLTLDDGRLFYYSNAGGSLLLRAPAVLQGRGQVEYKTIEQAGAALRPGGAGGYGTLAILGDLTNSTGTGVMEIEMGGAGAGEYDRLTVAARPPGSAGQATFGGTLKLTLAEGYTPADDDAFDILDFVSCGGPFDAIEFPGGAYWFWNTNDLYTTGVIRYEIPAALPAPAAVAASDAAYLNRIVVDWEPVVGATGYEVWRSLANDSATANLLAAVEESPFTDVTPVPDTTYYYWLKATNAYLVSAFSLSDAGSSLSDLPVPAAPQDVAAGDGDYMQQGRVWITWSAAADAIGYQIWRNASNDLATASLLGASAAPGFADTAVTVGVTNFYWIRGTNELYIGAFSLPDSGWMAPPAPFEIVWSNPAGGDYDDPANWTPGWIPGPTNRAVFSITPEPYTVVWSRPVTNSSYRVLEGSVAWNLNGHTYTVDALQSASGIGGSDSTTARLTITNGTLLNLGTGGAVAGHPRLQIRGPGSEMRLLNAKAVAMPYPFIYAPSRVVADGPAAEFGSTGYCDIHGAMIATNGAWLRIPSGSKMYADSDLQIHGGNEMHEVALSIFDPGATVRFAGDTRIRNYYVNAERQIHVSGRLILDGAYLYDYYTWPGFAPVVSIENAAASLEGSGTLGFSYLANNGLVAPGGTNGIGLLAVRGGVTNLPGGVIDIQLAGGATNAYDRLHAVVDAARGPHDGVFFADGSLRVTLADGFRPQAQGFKIFDFQSFAGAFDTIELPDIPGVWDTGSLAVDGTLYYQPPPPGTLMLLR